MRHPVTVSIIVTFLLTFLAHIQLSAQTPSLAVGDKAPDISVFRWIKGYPTLEFEKGKAHIVEFGATWCAPCTAAIPKLSALAGKYDGRATVTSFFVMEKNTKPTDAVKPDYVINVENYVMKRWDQMQYSIAVDDTRRTMENSWLRAAGKNGVPYVFILDKDGRIAWIGSETNKLDSIITFVLGKTYSIASMAKNDKKTAIEFDEKKLLLLGGNGGNEHDFAFRSVISKYDGKIKAPNQDFISSWRFGTDSAYTYYRDRVQLVGVSLAKLIYMAYADTLSNQVYVRNMHYQYPDTVRNPHHKSSYGRFWHLPVLEVADNSPFLTNKTSVKNRYNYSLKVPADLGTASFLQQAMQRDLKTYFGYEVTVETRNMPYWKLTVSPAAGGQKLLKSKTRNGKFNLLSNGNPFRFYNAEPRDIIWMLGSYFGFGSYDYGKLSLSEQAAFIDETGITYPIDFTFDDKMSFDEFRTLLQTWGLDLVKAWKPMKVVVVRDAVTHN